jgi:hypothetical protein
VQYGGALAQLVGGEHGLVVLLLVLGDHAEDESVGQQRGAVRVQGGTVEYVQGLFADLAEIGAGGFGGEQRQRGPVGPGVLERVVERVEVRTDGRPSAGVAHQPQFLLVADVGQVPDQG